MVQSHLNSEIEYQKHERFDKNDLNHETIPYDFSINDNDIEIALGKLHESNIDNNILFINVYKIEDETVKEHIGIFELYKKDKENIYDEDNDIDIERIGELLIFDNNKENSNVDKSEESDKEESNKEESDKEESYIEESNKEESDKEESDKEESDKEDSDKEESDKEDSDSDSDNDEDEDVWIKEFTDSIDYTIKDNEGGGDCFFAAVRDGLKTINRNITVQEIRKLLSKEVTEDLYSTYSLLYSNFITEKEELIKNNNLLKIKLNELMSKVKNSVNITEKTNLLKEIDSIKNKLSINKKELDVVELQLNDEFYFMSNVSSIDDFKTLIKTNKFWADTWAISTIERLLNIKVVVLSSQNYLLGDLNNVLLCGQLNDRILEERGEFNPTHYIVVEYTGDHYKLIKYRENGALTYNELPLFIIKLIKEKCIEKNAGPYYLIKDFKKMQEHIEQVQEPESVDENDQDIDKEQVQDEDKEQVQDEDKEQVQESEIDDNDEIDITSDIIVKPLSNQSKKNKSDFIDIKDTKLDINIDLDDLEVEDLNKLPKNSKKKLYDDNIVFQFYSKSSGARLPGRGAGEKIPDNKLVEFAVLSKIPEWRKKLSNFWVEPFDLDGHRWSSVEHFYQASKFKKNNHEFYLKFTLDKNPDSELSKDPVMAKAAGGKTGKYKGKIVRDKNIKMDESFIENNRFSTMKRAMKAKFTQNKDLKELLKATKNAKLQHYIRGSQPEVFMDLMEVRKEII